MFKLIVPFVIVVFGVLASRLLMYLVVQYNGGFLPDILLLTQAPNAVWFDGIIIVVLCTTLSLFCFVWWPCMVINVSVQYNGGLLPDIKLLTQGYYHQGTHLNAMKRFCLCSL